MCLMMYFLQTVGICLFHLQAGHQSALTSVAAEAVGLLDYLTYIGPRGPVLTISR